MRMMRNSGEKIVFLFGLIGTLFNCAVAVRFQSAVPGLLTSGQYLAEHQHPFANLTAYWSFLDDIFGYLSEKHENVSDRCRLETNSLLEYAKDGDSNALKIFDSTGKPSSGLLEGGIFFIGFYSECVNSVVKLKNESSLQGKYCLVNLNFSAPSHDEHLPQASWLVLTQGQKPPTIGICIPSSCSEEDLKLATTFSLNDNFDQVQGSVSVCHGNSNEFYSDVGALIVLVLLLLFVIIAILGTTIDFIGDRHKNVSNSNIFVIDSSKHASKEVLCDVQDPEPDKSSTVKKCLLAFSFKTNAQKIFTVESGGENIRAVHGLKFLSMALIILGHTFSFATQYLFFRNPGVALQAPKDFVSQIFANGTLAVDTFYFISGLLVAYVTLKLLKKTNGKFPLLYFYFHRYFRLTPLMVIVVLFCAFLLQYIGSGPNWLFTIQMYDVWCKKNGWINALYLHNFINTENMCLSHTWYLATDMQFYLVVPLILIPLYKSLKWGLVSMFLFLFVTVLTTAIITVVNHYPAIPYINNVLPNEIVNEYYKNVYIKPYCRIGPYIIGIGVGYYLLHKKELILKKATVVILWLSSVALGLTIIYLMWPANQGYLPTDAEAAAYSSLARSLWAVCLGWLTIACFYGYGGFINKILSWTPLVPLSRLTYSAYLIHPVVMNAYYGCTQNTVDFSQSFMLYLFLGNLCVTYVLSVLLSLLFESPFVALEKVFLKKKSS